MLVDAFLATLEYKIRDTIHSSITRGTYSPVWSTTLCFAEGVEPFDFVANAAGHLVGLACGAGPATNWAIFHVKAKVDMMSQVEQLLLGVQVGILVFFTNRATDPRLDVSILSPLARLWIGQRILRWKLDLVDPNQLQVSCRKGHLTLSKRTLLLLPRSSRQQRPISLLGPCCAVN